MELTSKTTAELLIFDSDHHSASLQPSSTFPNSFLYNWWLSIVSVVISVLALMAIVALLVIADGSSLPKLPLSITVNVYISFFVTIAKAAMPVAVSDSIGQLKWLWFLQPSALQNIQIFDEAKSRPFSEYFERVMIFFLWLSQDLLS